jgi:hypothetical protein
MAIARRVFPAPPQPSIATILVIRPAATERIRYASSSTSKFSKLTRQVGSGRTRGFPHQAQGSGVTLAILYATQI